MPHAYTRSILRALREAERERVREGVAEGVLLRDTRLLETVADRVVLGVLDAVGDDTGAARKKTPRKIVPGLGLVSSVAVEPLDPLT